MTISRTWRWLFLATGVLFGAAMARLYWQQTQVAAPTDDSRATDTARSQAENEGERLQALRLEMLELRARIAELEQNQLLADSTPTDWQRAESPVQRSDDTPRREDDYDANMAALGIDPDEAEALKQRYHRYLMEDMRLRDRAQREGLGGQTMREAMLENSARLRADLGADNYDRLLYALGRPNRLEVNEVMMGSPASDAGLLQGDLVMAYNGERVFSAVDLKRLIAQGESGEMVAVDVLRDDTFMQFYVPRGPIGIYMNNRRIPPD